MRDLRFVAVLAAFGLAACDVGPSVNFLNNSGAPVMLHLPEAGRYGRPLDVRLDQGRARMFTGEAVGRNNRYGVTAGQCDYVYEYPDIVGLNYPWFVADGKGNSIPDYRYSFPLGVQLEPDFRLYLTSPGTAHDGLGRPDPTPMHGFPISPNSRTCR